MKLNETMRNFIITWGELASRWGLNRTEASIHALLFISPTPLTMEEIADALEIARSNVSMSLKELQTWKIIRAIGVLRDRRKRYAAEKDVWVTFRNVFNEEKRRNIDPFIGLLDETKNTLGSMESMTSDEQHALDQVKEMREFFSILMSWYAEVNSMPLTTLRKYLTMGSKIRKLLGKE